MTVEIRNYQEKEGGWDDYVLSHASGSNYHRHGWRGVVERAFGHQTHYLTARRADQKICGLLPLVHLKSRLFGSFLVSLPFFNYGGLLFDDAAVGEALLARARELLTETGAGHVEMRHTVRWPGLTTRQHKVSMILDLEGDEEAQWQALDAKVRNQVRKAQKSGLQAVIGHLDQLNGFYEVFARNMRDLGTPVYGRGFFREILESFPESTAIVSIMLGGKTVASGLLNWFKDCLEVPWASSLLEYRGLCPNNLLYWEAIRLAIARGSARFDFGRSTPGEGTFRFKKQWGAQPVELHWQYLLAAGVSVPDLNPANPRFRSAIRVWRQLPLPVTKALGPLVVRNIP